MKIETREEIINALVEAAELEHGLMAQYLYAAMTLKGKNDGLTQDQASKVGVWSAWIRGVARQEMGHLATALNLLEAVGGGSHLERVRFPAPTRFYTPPIPFSLEPLTLDTIKRFAHFELPVHPVALLDIAPQPVIFAHVGELYSDLKDAIANFDEKELFIGRGSGQDQSTWSLDITVSPVTDRKSAMDAIDSIIVEGEGNSTGGDSSHYGRFKKIQSQYEAELAAHPDFVPHRNVVSNPATRDAPDAAHPDTTKITVENTLAAAKLFNACYTTLLLFLAKYYRFDETNDDNQEALKGVAKGIMMNVLAKLGPLLSQLPATADKNGGPPFEIYTPPSLPNDRDASLKILRERMGIAKAFATDLATKVSEGGIVQQVSLQLDALLQQIPA